MARDEIIKQKSVTECSESRQPAGRAFSESARRAKKSRSERVCSWKTIWKIPNGEGRRTRSRGGALPSTSPSALFQLGEACVSSYLGSRTVSITWITPFEQTMSALVTVASFTITLPPSIWIESSSPFTVFAEDSFVASAAITRRATTW